MGAVGELQFEVVKGRLTNEYGVDVRVERLSWQMARWVKSGEIPLARLESLLFGYGALDVHGSPVVLFKGEWQLEQCQKAYPDVELVELGASGPKIEG